MWLHISVCLDVYRQHYSSVITYRSSVSKQQNLVWKDRVCMEQAENSSAREARAEGKGRRARCHIWRAENAVTAGLPRHYYFLAMLGFVVSDIS